MHKVARFKHAEDCNETSIATIKKPDHLLRIMLIDQWYCPGCKRYMMHAKMFSLIGEPDWERYCNEESGISN